MAIPAAYEGITALAYSYDLSSPKDARLARGPLMMPSSIVRN